MLKTVDLIKNVENENQIAMLKMVNIPDFTKCIAQFAGLNIKDVSDDVIKEYLLTWAENKEKFFNIFGKKLRVDRPFEYKRMSTELENDIDTFSREFPIYAPWLGYLKGCASNSLRDLNWGAIRLIKDCFPTFKDNYAIYNTKITHFFKSYLQAPEILVTKLAGLFENDKVEATHTMSIDPVDMMLASENPYDWKSCYRLENLRDSHADGCLAAILDTGSIITYLWNSKGKYIMYDKYDFKEIRYYRMRQWLHFSDNLKQIHFNGIYPGKGSYGEEFEKQIRLYVEGYISDVLGIKNLWCRNDRKSPDSPHWDRKITIERGLSYGYSEFEEDRIYYWKDETNPNQEFQYMIPYNRAIKCPCGCGNELHGSDYPYEDDDIEFNGMGFIYENYEIVERCWCDYKDDWCYDVPCCDRCNCEDCYYWRDEHPNCSEDGEECHFEGRYTPEIEGGVVYATAEDCEGCPRWKECHSEDE